MSAIGMPGSTLQAPITLAKPSNDSACRFQCSGKERTFGRAGAEDTGGCSRRMVGVPLWNIGALLGGLNAVVLQFPPKRVPADAEHFCGTGLVPAHVVQDLEDMGSLHLVQPNRP